MRFAALTAAALLAALAGCEREAGTAQAPTPAVYRHTMGGAPNSLDPAHASNIYANALVVNLYDTLYRYKYLARPYALEPNLAESLPQVSADGLRYTIRIKPGVRFVDDPAFPGGRGRELKAEDFVYSIKRHFDPTTRSQGAWFWQGRIAGMDEWKNLGADYDAEVTGLRTLDERTIEIQLLAPFPQLPHTLAQGFSAIVPREAVEHHGREFGIRPVGSGPFRLQRFDTSGATLLRNDVFRQEPLDLGREGYDAEAHASLGLQALQGRMLPLPDRIEIAFIAEDAARWNTFVSGQADLINVPVTQFEEVLLHRNPPTLKAEYAARYQLLASVESGFVHTDFNMDDPRIGRHTDPQQHEHNRALRCAIIKAFDWQRRNEVFYFGLGHVFPGVIPPVAPEFDAALGRETVTRDLDGALRLLREGGWTPDNLPVLEYGFPSSVTERQMFEQFRSFLGEIGYPAEKIRPLTFATYGDYARAFLNREVMLLTTGWTMDYPDAENTVQLYYGPNASPGSNNSNYANEEFDRLYRASAVMLPSPERTALYHRMNRIVMDDCVTISGVARTLIMLWRRDLAMLPDSSFLGGHFFRFVPGRPANAE